MRAHVIDANVINMFQKERLADHNAEGAAVIESITTNNYIAIDDEGPCAHEWIECAGGAYPLALSDWMADMLIAQKLRLAELCTDSLHKELTSLGMPKKDHKWVRLALGAGSLVIISDDIDFYDPQMKNAPSATIKKMKEKGAGPVAKHLSKKRKISVVCPSKVPQYVQDCENAG